MWVRVGCGGDLDLDLGADLKPHRTPRGSTMASPTTLQIGRPCHMRCTPQALDGPFPAPLALGWCQGHALLGIWSTPSSNPKFHCCPLWGRRATRTLSLLLPQPPALPWVQGGGVWGEL